ncbi:MAG TPA: hypothetical protein VNB23_09890 [Ramlibacter sp.]|nr:hypothetical protein [Ramlibacter sp.]
MKCLVTWAAAAAAMLLAGCANQTSIWRNEHGAGNVMAMDAQQRVVLSSSRGVPTPFPIETTTTTEGAKTVTSTRSEIRVVPKVHYCPEPSPDAIASFASALGIGASKSTGTETLDAKLNSALSTAVAAVGLRTPTTQVIRDLITAACVADLNGSFESPAFKDAFARNQQFVLAAHAIAVMGGEAVAGQPGVSGTSGTSGPDPVATYNNLKSAQAARQAAETKEKTEATALADSETKLTTAADNLKKDPTNATLKTAVDDATKARDAQQGVHNDAKARLKDAQTVESAATRAANAANAFTAAAAAGTVTPGTTFVVREKISDKAVEAISDITQQVLMQGFTLDKCITHLREIASLPNAIPETDLKILRDSVLSLCQAQATEQARVFNLRSARGEKK